ncbi:sugar ABC transporter substrate-binding protein, partial [Salmonella enterica subsp. enterica serovar Panama]|nr:sugar ABC transporter substrate-binding protein [Salmonella enterica subsp. enterica serovar Panama]
MRVLQKFGAFAVAAALSFGALASVHAQEVQDPFRDPALESLKGKKIAYLPISIGFDLAQAWGGVVKQQSEVYGMSFTSQDPNWNTDAMAQGFTALLAEKPDVIVTQNPDMQSLARLMKQANAEGIVVVQLNMAGAVQTDAVVAPDFIGMGEKIAQKVVEKCGKGTNTSHKVSVVQGVLTGGVSFYQIQGINKVFAENPDIQVVSSQAADWDAS